MSKIITITRKKDLPEKLDFMEYLVTVHKDGKFVKGFLHKGYSGTAMMDEMPDYRKAYPLEKGYKVEW